MKNIKRFKKIFLFNIAFSLLFNSLSPLFFYTPVVAQTVQPTKQIEVNENTSEDVDSENNDTTKDEEEKEEEKEEEESVVKEEVVESAEKQQQNKEVKVTPTPTPTKKVTPTPTVLPTPVKTPSVTPLPTVVDVVNNEEEDTDATKQTESNEKSEEVKLFSEIDDNKIQTNQNAKVGVWYAYKDSGFKIKFSEIKGDAKLVIEQIKLSDKQVEELGALTNVAYDVYFNPQLTNASFKYQMEFPLNDESSQDVKVQYAENKDKLNEAKLNPVESKIKVEEGKVKVDELNHFTVFVVTKDESGECPSGVYLANECYETIQQAINDASNGDDIEVKEGTYEENLSFPSGLSNVSIEGDGDKDNIIIKANNSGSYGVSVGSNSNNISFKNLTLYDDRVGSKSSTDSSNFHVKISHNSGFTLVDTVLDGSGSDAYSTGLDLNTTKEVNLNNVVIKNYGRNAFSVTSTCNSSDSSENITFEDITIENGGWTAMAFYTESGPSCNTQTRDIKGVEFKGTNYIKDSPVGIYLSGVKESAGVVTDEYNTVVEGKDGDRLELNDTQFSGNSINIVNWTVGNVGALNATFDGYSNLHSYSSGLNDVESKLLHNCVTSPYQTGTCDSDTGPLQPNGAKDLTNRYGSIEYANDFPTKAQCEENFDKMPICHATSSSTNQYNLLYLPCNAIYGNSQGQGGHLNENGSTASGHEDDTPAFMEDGEYTCPGEVVSVCTEESGFLSTPGLSAYNTFGQRSDGSDVPSDRTELTNLIGSPDNKFVSLGEGGTHILITERPFLNVVGSDLYFYEVTNERNNYPLEQLKVEVSQNLTDWVEVGVVTNKDNDNGAGVGALELPDFFTWAQFIKITDVTDFSIYSSLSTPGDGYDLDAIEIAMLGCGDYQYEDIPIQIPLYNSIGQCSEGEPLLNTKQTVTVLSTDADGEFVTLDTNKQYLFNATGNYYASGTRWQADSGGYSSNNNYSSVSPLYGINGTNENYAAHALLGDLGEGVGVINWGDYTNTHNYNFYYQPTISTVQLVIGDRYGDWFNTPYQNQSGMNDNSGDLQVDIYECGIPNGQIQGYKYVNEQIPYEGVQINLCRVDNLGGKCLGDEQVTTTDVNGYYSFSDLALGIYKVWEVLPGGFTPAYPQNGVYYIEVLGGTQFKYLGNLVYNGDFEYPQVTNNKNWDIYPNNTPLLGWSVEWVGNTTTYKSQTRPSDANLELHSGVNNWKSNTGKQHAELDTDWDGPQKTLNLDGEPANVKISQMLPTCDGGDFNLSYAYAPRPKHNNSNIQVLATGSVVNNHSGSSNSNSTSWNQVSGINFLGGEIAFLEQGSENALGMLLDTVVVEQNNYCNSGNINFYNTQPKPLQGEVVVEKINDINANGSVEKGEDTIDDWGVVIHKISDDLLVDEFSVDSGSPLGKNTSVVLSSTKKYLVEVTGTWQNKNGSRLVDANYYSDNNWSSVNDLDNDNTRDSRQLDLVINEQDINWGTYPGSSHLYKAIITGNDSTSNFRIFDEDNDTNKPSWYNDNSGELNVKIYDVTSEYYTTPVTVSLEPGDYQVVEQQVGGWQQTYPTNPSYYEITVKSDSSQQLNFLNYQLPTKTDLQVCKQDTNQNYLPGWVLGLLGEKVDTVTVYPDGETYSSKNLPQDDYVLVANGSYEYRGSSGLISDASYSERKPTDGYSGPYFPFINVLNLGTPGALGIQVNANPTSWSNYYSPTNTYYLGFNDYSQGQFDFYVYDNVYSDNVGEFTVDIYKGYRGETGDNGCFIVEDVDFGSYEVVEQLKQGYTNVSGLGEVQVSESTDQILVVNKESPKYTIEGFKFNDINNNAEYNDEPLLGGWTVFIDENNSKQLDDGEQSTTTNSEGPNLGWYSFTDLPQGTYSVCEVNKQGWQQTYPVNLNCHSVTFGGQSEQLKYHNFGNYAEPIEAIIETQNSTVNGANSLSPGDTATFTLKVLVSGNSGNNLQVTDLPSNDVEVLGNFTVTSSVDSSKNTTNGATYNPNYASPGVWNLGSVVDGEEITITYEAKVKETATSGVYKSLAYSTVEHIATNEQVVANAQNNTDGYGFIDSNFVGSNLTVEAEVGSPKVEVEIDEEEEEEVIEVEEEGAVLGASTSYLPATGSSTTYLIISVLLFIVGLLLVNLKRIKKHLVLLILMSFISVLLSPTILAYSPGVLNVQLDEPLTNQNSGFNVGFTTLYIDTNPTDTSVVINAYCYLKKSGGSEVLFDSNLNIQNTKNGNSGVCNITTSSLSGNGSYDLWVKAEAVVNESATNYTVEKISSTYNFNYDSSNPGEPEDFKVDKKDSCKYNIEFKTDNDGQTAYVEVYRSKNKEFSADTTTRVNTITIGPNTKYEYDDVLFGSECGDNYYAIRAFDLAGNASDIVAMEDVKIITTTKTVTTSTGNTTQNESGALVVNETAQLGTGELQGDILGDENNDEEQVSEEQNSKDNESQNEEGDVLGEEDSSTSFFSGRGVLYTIILGILVLLIVLFSAKKFKPKS